MKPEQQRIRIAEFCGWKDCHLSASWASIIGTLYEVNGNQYAMIPNYFSDLNAMHEAEKILTAQQRRSYVSYIFNLPASECESNTFATAAQRAEAFLKTISLWEK